MVVRKGQEIAPQRYIRTKTRFFHNEKSMTRAPSPGMWNYH